MMLFIMYPLILIEMLVILLLSFRSPLRKVVMAGLSRLKIGRGTVVAQTLIMTIFVLFVTNLYGLIEVRKRFGDALALNPTDQVLLAFNLLQATLLGITLFLALMIDRLHYYINELRRVRKKSEDYQLHAKTKNEVHN